MANYYLGTVLKVLDPPDLYKILIDLPGLSKEAEAFPMRGELDEPRPGDQVLVRDVDPIYHSFYLYSKLKDDDFIGFRSRGKMIQMTENELNISIFDPSETYEENEKEIPKKIKSSIKIYNNGDIEVSNMDSDSGKVNLDLKGDITITSHGNTNIEISGNSEIYVNGKATIDSPNVTIKGGILNVKGSATPTGSGPFCSIPICPLTGAPHVGSKVMGT